MKKAIGKPNYFATIFARKSLNSRGLQMHFSKDFPSGCRHKDG